MDRQVKNEAIKTTLKQTRDRRRSQVPVCVELKIKTQIAQDMKLLYGPDENLRPRNIALLMFSDRINVFFPYARIEFVDIPEPTGRHMNEKTFTGPIQDQLRNALLYIENNVLEEKITKIDGEAITLR